MTFEDIQKEYAEDIQWDEFNASSKISKLSSYVVKYQNMYYNGLKKLNTITEALGKKYQELYIYYKLDFEIKLKDTEIKTFIETNSEYLSLKTAKAKLENQINYFEDCIKNLNNMRWDIKTYLEFEKFKQGLV
jgi:ribosome-associated translation inhibitor RaiA